jgi:chaperonin GroEL
MAVQRTRNVVFQPLTYQVMQEGIRQMVGVVRPTLGPRPGIVAVDPIVPGRLPEILDDGGTIVRRIIQVPDRDEDMGAMLVRHVVWDVYQKVGDGTATTAVVFQSVFDQGVHYLTSGGNAMRLRHYLEKGMVTVLDELSAMAQPVVGKEELIKMAESVCYDPDLAKMLGEIFDIIGEYGRLEIRSGRSSRLEREYIEGMYWKGKIMSRDMVNDKAELRATLDNAHVLITDLIIEDPRDLIPALALAVKSDVRRLMIIAKKLSESALGLLLLNNKKNGEKLTTIAVEVPGLTITDIAANLADVAALTGGQHIARSAGDTLARLKVEDLGRARRVWGDRYHFGITGGQGDPRRLRAHIASLRQAYDELSDKDDRDKVLERIGKLMGGSATLWVGAFTESDIKARKEVAKRTADAMRAVVREGVVPGGGVALLACRPALRRMLENSTDDDERAAYRILIRAMEEPMRTIASNAGYDPSDVMAEVRHAGPGHGFDARSGEIVDLGAGGVLDAVAVQKAAVRGAIETGALALTIDVLMHRKNPPDSMKP